MAKSARSITTTPYTLSVQQDAEPVHLLANHESDPTWTHTCICGLAHHAIATGIHGTTAWRVTYPTLEWVEDQSSIPVPADDDWDDWDEGYVPRYRCCVRCGCRITPPTRPGPTTLTHLGLIDARLSCFPEPGVEVEVYLNESEYHALTSRAATRADRETLALAILSDESNPRRHVVSIFSP